MVRWVTLFSIKWLRDIICAGGISISCASLLPLVHARLTAGPSWEAEGPLANSQEIHRLLWNPNIHYRVHKSPSLNPTLSQMNPVHALTPYYFNIHFNIFLHLCLGLLSGSFIHVFRLIILRAFVISLSVLRALPSDPYWFDHPTWWKLKIMKLLIVQFSSSSCFFVFGPNNLLSISFPNTDNKLHVLP
jgi:hypothetical protein